MIRYYYLDALAAAWMQKHFGMRFQRELVDREFSQMKFFLLSNISLTE